MGILSDGNVQYLKDVEQKTTRDFTNIRLFGQNILTNKSWQFDPNLLRNVTEWEAGVYTVNPTIVKNYGQLYMCNASIPFTSSDFETELSLNQWVVLITQGIGTWTPEVNDSYINTLEYTSSGHYVISSNLVYLYGKIDISVGDSMTQFRISNPQVDSAYNTYGVVTGEYGVTALTVDHCIRKCRIFEDYIRFYPIDQYGNIDTSSSIDLAASSGFEFFVTYIIAQG